MNKFIERIALAKLDGSLLKVINRIEKNDLVIFDDFGLQPLDNNSRLALLQILEDCYQRKSVIVTSQLPYPNGMTTSMNLPWLTQSWTASPLTRFGLS